MLSTRVMLLTALLSSTVGPSTNSWEYHFEAH